MTVVVVRAGWCCGSEHDAFRILGEVLRLALLAQDDGCCGGGCELIHAFKLNPHSTTVILSEQSESKDLSQNTKRASFLNKSAHNPSKPSRMSMNRHDSNSRREIEMFCSLWHLLDESPRRPVRPTYSSDLFRNPRFLGFTYKSLCIPTLEGPDHGLRL